MSAKNPKDRAIGLEGNMCCLTSLRVRGPDVSVVDVTCWRQIRRRWLPIHDATHSACREYSLHTSQGLQTPQSSRSSQNSRICRLLKVLGVLFSSHMHLILFRVCNLLGVPRILTVHQNYQIAQTFQSLQKSQNSQTSQSRHCFSNSPDFS